MTAVSIWGGNIPVPSAVNGSTPISCARFDGRHFRALLFTVDGGWQLQRRRRVGEAFLLPVEISARHAMRVLRVITAHPDAYVDPCHAKQYKAWCAREAARKLLEELS